MALPDRRSHVEIIIIGITLNMQRTFLDAAWTLVCAVAILSAVPSCICATDRDLIERLDDLNSRLTYAAYVRPTNLTDWINQCAYYFKLGGFQLEGGMNPMYSTYYLRDKPSGLCTLRLSAGLKDMAWSIPIQEVFAENDLLRVTMEDISGALPPLELPGLMSFPATARDVVEIAKFASTHGIQVSIKNSGHSYAGQSTRGGSLQVNMRSYPKYSATELVECKDVSGDKKWAAACKLATARGKKAVVRVGGGEGNDDIVRHVSSWNYELPRERTYDVLVGAEGIVGMGWLFGGGLGIGQERQWGVGVDQVLEIEMVLPDGRHVKFGPDSWRVKEGYLYPQTTSVKGYCNANVHHLEDKWEWTECEVGGDLTWDDLWFAVRGGGGGSFGIILSVTYQLHDLEPYYGLITSVTSFGMLNETCTDQGNVCDDVFDSLTSTWADFLITYLWDPTSLNVSQSVSNMCGYSSAAFDIFGSNWLITCRTSDAAKSMHDAWKAYVPTSKYLDIISSDNETLYIPLFQNVITSCEYTGGTRYRFMIGFSGNGAIPLQCQVDGLPQSVLTEAIVSSYPKVYATPAGHLSDTSGPGTYQQYGWSALFPTSAIVNYNRDFMVEFFGFTARQIGHHVMGGNIAISGDGMDSLPDSFRQAGVQMVLPQYSSNFTEYDELASKLSGLFLAYLGADYNSGLFPGYTEINHQGGWGAGPLKDNWNISCPLGYTAEERARKCISVQESQHGTVKWRRLQQIKERLDPNLLYDVRYGIGNTDATPSPPPYAYQALKTPDSTTVSMP